MKLVGATDCFIRWPFVIEGVVLGALRRHAARSCCSASARSRSSTRCAVGLRAHRRAADDRLRAAGRRCCSSRASRSRPSGRACRCAASCASEPARLALRFAAGADSAPRSLCGRPCSAARCCSPSPDPGGPVRGHLRSAAHPERAARPRARPVRRRQRRARRQRGDRRGPRPLLPQDPALGRWPTTRSPASSPRSTTASRSTSRPKDYAGFQQSQNASSRASGISVSPVTAGCASSRSSTARRPSRPSIAARRRHRRRRRHSA